MVFIVPSARNIKVLFGIRAGLMLGLLGNLGLYCVCWACFQIGIILPEWSKWFWRVRVYHGSQWLADLEAMTLSYQPWIFPWFCMEETLKYICLYLGGQRWGANANSQPILSVAYWIVGWGRLIIRPLGLKWSRMWNFKADQIIATIENDYFLS